VTIETELRAFKTKLRVNEKDYPKQFKYLMNTAKACTYVRNWYVREALERMKNDGVTVFSSKEELKRYSPRELRKVLTALINSDSKYAWLKGIPSTPRTYVFEQIQKTYEGSKGVKYNFIFQCKCMAEKIEERIKKLKEEASKEGRILTEEEIEKEKVFFNGKRAYKPDELYKVKGFPRFIKEIRHTSFPIDNVIVDSKNKCIILPASQGNKKFNIPKMESVKVCYYDHDLNPEGMDKSALYTISYDGQDWWMSVKQRVEVAKSPVNQKDDILGIDLGIKTTAYLSNGKKINNITEDENLKKLEKRSKYLDALRKKNLEKSPIEKIKTPWGKAIKPKSAKYKKLTKHIQAIDNKIMRYKDTLIKQQVAGIFSDNVKGIVFEDFSVEPLKHNKDWSGKVQKICIGLTRQLIINKAKSLGIPVMKAPRNFPSTQLCSSCGKRNEHMKNNLKERTFKCEFCGHTLDRDLNASKNLAQLWGSPELKNWED
jgi:putative transposase